MPDLIYHWIYNWMFVYFQGYTLLFRRKHVFCFTNQLWNSDNMTSVWSIFFHAVFLTAQLRYFSDIIKFTNWKKSQYIQYFHWIVQPTPQTSFKTFPIGPKQTPHTYTPPHLLSTHSPAALSNHQSTMDLPALDAWPSVTGFYHLV